MAHPSVPMVGFREMHEVLGDSVGRRRLLAQFARRVRRDSRCCWHSSHGVLSFMVAERRLEIGVRIAASGSS
jgi:hypothetical protein